MSSSLRPRIVLSLVLSAFPLAFGCSSASTDGDGTGSGGAINQPSGGAASGGSASGGTSPSGGAAPTGGAPSSGGSASGGRATGGALSGSGGVVSAGGGPASGGTGTGGEDGGSGGSGATPVEASAGCSKGSATFTVSNAKVGYPEGYDGTKPFPVVFAFHAAGNNNSQLENHFGNTVVGDKYVMIYLQASGSGWNFQMDRSRYETAYTQVLENGCVDENRVFAIGHSSGAQMIVQLLCGGVTDFDGVVPVASSVYCNGWDDEVPALVIHGLDDQERCAYGLDDCDGRKDIVPYRSSNGCTETKVATDLDVGTQCGGSINPGCMEFEGCSAPTYFCNHNDPQYSNTNHGIPCFATAAISDFLGRL